MVEWVPLRGGQEPASIQRGQVDAATAGMLPHDPPGAEGLSAVMGPLAGTQFLVFTEVPSYEVDLNLRKALAHATDRLAMEPLPHYHSAAHGGLVPPGIPGHTPDIALRFDPGLARQFLKRSNHHGSFVLASSSTFIPPYLEKLTAVWRDLLDLDIRTLEIPKTESASVFVSAHVRLSGWTADYPDPESFLHMVLHSRSPSRRVHRWSSPRFDALVDRARAQDTGGARMALFHEADRLAIQEECALIPLVYNRSRTLVQPWLHGWWEWGGGELSYDELTIDERSPRHRGLD
jgi:ABC-type transport system substrate-binding protein